MRPERIVAAALSALAAVLVALLVVGPTAGAEATRKPEAAPAPAPTTGEQGTTEAAPTTEEAQTEPAPETTTEVEPAEPPRPLAGDGTFPQPVRMMLESQEYRWKTADLDGTPPRVRVDARVIALQGGPGDQHGLGCSTAEATYEATVNPWAGSYQVLRWNSAGDEGIELERGAASGLERPPAPNALRLTCVASPEGARILLAANGKRIASAGDHLVSAGFVKVDVLANDGSEGQDVVFDGVVVQTGTR